MLEKDLSKVISLGYKYHIHIALIQLGGSTFYDNLYSHILDSSLVIFDTKFDNNINYAGFYFITVEE